MKRLRQKVKRYESCYMSPEKKNEKPLEVSFQSREKMSDYFHLFGSYGLKFFFYFWLGIVWVYLGMLPRFYRGWWCRGLSQAS